MLVMHLYFVGNMNTSARAFVVYIVVLSLTRAAEIESDYKSSTSTANSKETTTVKWKKSTNINKWEQPTTKKVEPVKLTKWDIPTTTKYKELTKFSNWKPDVSTNWKRPTNGQTIERNRQSPVNHMFAAASISNIDSRNGRVSSMNGINIYPPVDSSMVKSDNKGNFVFKTVNDKMPITITKQGDGVSGIIRIQPGSVSVSSSASSKSGPSSEVASFSPWSKSFMMPPFNDIYFPPFPTFTHIPDPGFDSRISDSPFNTRISDPFTYMRIPEPAIQSRIQDPWFDSNFHRHSQKLDIFRPKWYYPSFNPFMNFW